MAKLDFRIERFLRTGEGEFESLALELFGYQFERNLPYRAYCESQDLHPESVKRWQEIPAVPIQAFKSSELATFPVGRSAAIFESSGTTVKSPSRHYLKTLTFYESSLKTSFASAVIPAKAGTQNKYPFFILTPPPGEAPRSSLSWMMDVVKRRWGEPDSQYFIRQGRLDDLWLAAMMVKMQAAGTPVVLLGTTIAFLDFFDYCRSAGRRFTLPQGSRLMDTGGMKTHKRKMSRPDFVRQVGEFVGIPDEDCLNEYGMCEMSSQFYGRGASTHLEGPVWVRTLVMDPATGLEAAEGEPGLLTHFDLANVDSVMAIQTEDLGRKDGQGFILLGRAPAADLKGCSISAEAYLR